MSESRRARTALGDRPDGGPFSQYIHDELLRHNVAKNHGFAEGFVPDAGAVSRGYDRNESPWMHGRRAHDIIRRVREVTGRGK